MSDPGPEALPPVLVPPEISGAAKAGDATPHPLRSAIALLLLVLYIVVPATLGATRLDTEAPILPTGILALLKTCVVELALFGTVFVAAIWLGRVRFTDLWVGWRGGYWLVPRAIGWSIALRFATGLVLGSALIFWQFASGQSFENLGNIRPKVEALVSIDALNDPVYFVLMLTVVSFIVAGLREELWRAAMIRLLGRNLPRVFGGKLGMWFALFPVALLFGLGHTPQGWFGVAATGVLGLGLGAVMLFHRSLWDAVLAHGFFNAASFVAIPWLARHLPELLK